MLNLGRKLAAWSTRRDAYRRLTALDDRMLADIGLNRAEIPAVVKAMSRTPAGSVEGSFESEVVLPLKQWNLWRDAHKQLSQLDNHMLSDIGLVRGDIDCATEAAALVGLVDGLAVQATFEPRALSGARQVELIDAWLDRLRA